MKSKDFLRSKGILSNDSDHFIIYFHDGREINLAGLLEEYTQQSQPSGMRWVDDVNKIRGQAKAFGDKYSGSISEQAAAEVGFNAAINQVINILSESSPAGAAEGIKCKCPDNIKHGQTSVMCCNHCGLPDEDFWNNCG